MSCANPGCSKVATNRCGTCRMVQYCSKDCQKLHWPEHKKILHKKYTIPPVDDEYARAFPSDTEGTRIIHVGTHCLQNLINDKIKDLLPENLSNMSSLRQRWLEVSPALFSFLQSSPKIGDVFRDRTFHPYTDNLYRGGQNYRSTPNILHPELKKGRNVIEVGFVDFGMTIDTIHTLEDQHEEGPPVVVYALEQEPFCIAKSLVMIEMMKIPTTTARNIVEVWMSTLWSSSTFKLFHKALQTMLQSTGMSMYEEQRKDMESTVRRILEFWFATSSKGKISKQEAIELWFQTRFQQYIGTSDMHSVNLLLPGDRVAAFRYVVTGALYEDSFTTTGSIIMGSKQIKQLYLNCLEAAPTSIHIDFRDLDFMSRYRHYFENKMELFMKHIRAGNLVFQPHCMVVSHTNTKAVSFMKSLRPCAVAWSNLIDYMKPSHFHSMAKEISTEDTVHYVHSCNWINSVFGADPVDYPEVERGALFEEGFKVYSASQEQLGFNPTPTTIHSRNICQPALLPKSINPFLRYFFANQDVVVGTRQGECPIPSLVNPFLAANSVAHFKFAYDRSRHDFQDSSYDYMI